MAKKSLRCRYQAQWVHPATQFYYLNKIKLAIAKSAYDSSCQVLELDLEIAVPRNRTWGAFLFFLSAWLWARQLKQTVWTVHHYFKSWQQCMVSLVWTFVDMHVTFGDIESVGGYSKMAHMWSDPCIPNHMAEINLACLETWGTRVVRNQLFQNEIKGRKLLLSWGTICSKAGPARDGKRRSFILETTTVVVYHYKNNSGWTKLCREA